MKVALVGNNDGPLILARSMAAEGKLPVCIGLQKPVSDTLKTDTGLSSKKVRQDLKTKYVELVGEENFFSDFKESRLLKLLEDYDFDILINCFCNFKFRKLLDRYTVLNVHLAPLPKYRGRHPLHAALINGETEFGFTVHKMDADFDAGEIYWQETVPVESGMSVEELRSALMTKLAVGFGDFLEDYEEGNIAPLSNPDTEASYAPKRKPDDSRLTEWHDRDTIFRKVMALRSGNHPAYFVVNGKKIVVTKAELERGTTDNEKTRLKKSAGEKIDFEDSIYLNTVFVEQLHENGVSIRCKDGRRIALYGFHPEENYITKNQELI